MNSYVPSARVYGNKYEAPHEFSLQLVHLGVPTVPSHVLISMAPTVTRAWTELGPPEETILHLLSVWDGDRAYHPPCWDSGVSYRLPLMKTDSSYAVTGRCLCYKYGLFNTS